MKLFGFVIIFLFFSLAYGQSHLIEITPEYNLSLKKSEWDFAKGRFFSSHVPLNLFSHKKNKEFQVLFEDMSLVTSTVLSKLPKNCGQQITSKNLEAGANCHFSQKTDFGYSFTTMSLFNTNVPNVIRVRTVHFVGKKENVSVYESKVKRGIASVKNKRGQK